MQIECDLNPESLRLKSFSDRNVLRDNIDLEHKSVDNQ